MDRIATFGHSNIYVESVWSSNIGPHAAGQRSLPVDTLRGLRIISWLSFPHVVSTHGSIGIHRGLDAINISWHWSSSLFLFQTQPINRDPSWYAFISLFTIFLVFDQLVDQIKPLLLI